VFDREVIFPALGARMEDAEHLRRIRVHGAEVCSLEKVAPLTGPREIRRVVKPGVLLRDDVIEVKRPKGKVHLVKATVFATPAGAVADPSADARRHYAAECSVR